MPEVCYIEVLQRRGAWHARLGRCRAPVRAKAKSADAAAVALANKVYGRYCHALALIAQRPAAATYLVQRRELPSTYAVPPAGFFEYPEATKERP